MKRFKWLNPFSGFSSFFVDVQSDDSLTYQWQQSTDSVTWTNLVEDTLYTGVTNDTLILKVVQMISIKY